MLNSLFSFNGFPTGAGIQAPSLPGFSGVDSSIGGSHFTGAAVTSITSSGQVLDLRGFGFDMDNDNSFTQGRDGILVIDFSKNGKIDAGDVERTQNALSSLNGDNSFLRFASYSAANLEGYQRLRQEGKDLDRDGNGTLSKLELQRAGARVWVDRNRDGKMTDNELSALPENRGQAPTNTAGGQVTTGIASLFSGNSNGGIFGMSNPFLQQILSTIYQQHSSPFNPFVSPMSQGFSPLQNPFTFGLGF